MRLVYVLNMSSSLNKDIIIIIIIISAVNAKNEHLLNESNIRNPV